jgi:hypothetical protein
MEVRPSVLATERIAMNQVRRLVEAVVELLPLPDAMGGSRRPVDPRVDPEALEAFGEQQLAQFGVGQGHQGGAPLPTHYVLGDAEAARLELEREAAASDAEPEGDAEDELDRDACP